MKELTTKSMQEWLKKGLKKIKILKAPREGYLIPLFNRTTKNGWHYQVDYINRFDILQVTVYAFKPPVCFECRSAEYYLTQYVKGVKLSNQRKRG